MFAGRAVLKKKEAVFRGQSHLKSSYYAHLSPGAEERKIQTRHAQADWCADG